MPSWANGSSTSTAESQPWDSDFFPSPLAKALREERQRTSSKVSRVWPRRVNHRPPKLPTFLMLTPEQKALAGKLLSAAPKAV
jgi:hypothetical protein